MTETLLLTRDGDKACGLAHASLRSATRAIHGRLEARFDSASFGTRAGYVRFLQMSWPSAAIERALTLAGIEHVLPDWPLRQRRFALAADLTMLGATMPDADPCIIETDIGTLLGWSYVLEGSRLGARLVLRDVRAAAEPALLGATQFLRHGEGRPFWTSFKTVLARIDGDAAQTQRACAAASAAFAYFSAAPENSSLQ
ncbi:MAG: biliverdin-producing heme oxygenase [Dongiaceae bacterium]